MISPKKTPEKRLAVLQECAEPIFRRSSMSASSEGERASDAFRIMKQEKGGKVKKKSGSAFPSRP
jgi:hypothetical protein